MSAKERDYRVRIATPGADVVEGHVDYTLGLADLDDIPVVTGQIPHLLVGATESRPWNVHALDHAGAFTTALAAGGRWTALGRLIDVQYRDLPAGSWTTYGTGRISDVGEPDGPGRYRIEVSDESWKARTARIFEVADTTQIWPPGIKAQWRGHLGSGPLGGFPPADGTRVGTAHGNLYRIRLRPRVPLLGRDELMKWVQSDVVDHVEGGAAAAARAAGNFKHLRLNYDGVDYEIVSFGEAGTVQELAGLFRDLAGPSDIRPPGGLRLEQTDVFCWIYAAAAPPLSGPAYLHAPTAPPSAALPLHVGLTDPTHDWGSETGFLHPATLTRRFWELTGQRFDAASLSAIEADTSFPHLALRITETPADPERFFQDHVWGPNLLIALRDGEGRRKLVDLRLPQDIDPDTLPVIDASNGNAQTWRLRGAEAITSITWRYLHTRDGRIAGGYAAVRQHIDARVADPAMSLDGLVVEERTYDPFIADTAGALGVRDRQFRLLGAFEPSALVPRTQRVTRDGLAGTLFEGAVAALTRDIFEAYRDGPVGGAIEISGTLAEQIQEGDLVVLDQSSLRGANPETAARTGHRIVRVLALTTWPAHGDIEYLDVGPRLQPLAPPTVSIVQDPQDLTRTVVTLGGIVSGGKGELQVAYAPSASVPDAWQFHRVDLAAGDHVFLEAPGSGYAHVRARTTMTGRVRSPWVYDSVALTADPRVSDVGIAFEGPVPIVTGELNAHAAGVRIRYALHARDVAVPSLDTAEDFDAAGLADGARLATQLAPRQLITAEVEPWSDFAAGEVAGNPGPAVAVSAQWDGRPTHTDGVTVTVLLRAEGGQLTVTVVSESPGIQRVQAWLRRGSSPIGPDGEPRPEYLVIDREVSAAEIVQWAEDGTWHAAARGIDADLRPGPLATAEIDITDGGGAPGGYPVTAGSIDNVTLERTEGTGEFFHRLAWAYTEGEGGPVPPEELVRVELSIDDGPFLLISPDIDVYDGEFEAAHPSCTPGEAGCSWVKFVYRLLHLTTTGLELRRVTRSRFDHSVVAL